MVCELDGARLHYEAAGEGTPVLMIHGFSLDLRSMASCMEPVFRGRSEGWMRIYVDLPGMGQSPAPAWPGSSDRVLQLLLSFIDAVIPGRGFLVAGDSYGGYLARGVVNRRQASVEGLLLVCPVIAARASDRDVPPLTVLVRDEALLGGMAESQRRDFAASTVVQTARTWERFSSSVLPGMAMGDKEFQDELHGKEYALSFDVDDLELPFVRPALFLLGRQDSVVGYRDAWKLLVHYPRASFAILDRAGHSLEIEQETLFRALAGEWLDRVVEHRGAGAGRHGEAAGASGAGPAT
jgi:pimeloyl-ACP methyl ester carboxylesterase